jgi:hypothetical protein
MRRNPLSHVMVERDIGNPGLTGDAAEGLAKVAVECREHVGMMSRTAKAEKRLFVIPR